MGLTSFGRELRKMRIDRGETLKTMADKLGCTSSYLSGIECGKHSVPVSMVLRLRGLYQFTDEEVQRLEAARDLTLTKASIDLEDATEEQRNAALLFARTLKELLPEDLKKIQGILSNK